MRNGSTTGLLIFAAFLLTASCNTSYQPQTVKFIDYRLTKENKKDSALIKLLQPYADSVNKSMNALVVVTETELEKKQPEGTLGNIMADAMLAKAKQAYKTNVDAAFVNYGGIRLTAVPAGAITRGKIFELAPFDNIIVLLKMNGAALQEFLNHISGRGGWPAAGVQWQIKNAPARQAVNVRINGTAIDATAVYTIAVVDYVANGGDDCIMLKNIPQLNNGYLYRDALTEYLREIHQQGKKLAPKIENRVTNAE
jgi:2',3'-cyclic-nucleotide 2'-phosphodiesterase (5'-nucleotidase family)